MDNTVIKTEFPPCSETGESGADKLYADDIKPSMVDSGTGARSHGSTFHLVVGMAGNISNLAAVTDDEMRRMGKELFQYAVQARTKIHQLQVNVRQLETDVRQLKADNCRRTPKDVLHDNLDLKQQIHNLEKDKDALERDKSNLQIVIHFKQILIDLLQEQKEQHLRREFQLIDALGIRGNSGISINNLQQSEHKQGQRNVGAQTADTKLGLNL